MPRAVCLEATAPNYCWSIVFVSDRLADGRAFWVFSLRDNVSRVSPALAADFIMSGERVCEVMNRAIVAHGLSKTIRLGSWPEFAGKALDAWTYRLGVKLCFSRPGTAPPTTPSVSRSTESSGTSSWQPIGSIIWPMFEFI